MNPDPPNNPGAPAARRHVLPHVLPWVVLVCTLLSAFTVAYYVWSKDRLRGQFAAAEAAREARDRIQNRMDGHVSVLRGAAGFVAPLLKGGAGDLPARRAEFAEYVARLELARHHPGIQGLGFSLRLDGEEVAGFERQMRDAGTDGFRVWDDAPAATTAPTDRHPIVYLEPPDARNRAAVGFDMASEPARREAMARARDQAAPAATGAVTLKQETGEADRQQGLLIFLPVYHTGAPPPSIAERRIELAGFVYAAFRAGDLLGGIYGEGRQPIDFTVYDGTAPGAVMLDRTDDGAPPDTAATDTAPPAVPRGVGVGGRTWDLRFRPRARPELSLRTALVPAIALGGCGLAALLFMLTRAQGRTRLAAESTAAELRRSQAALERANASLGLSEARLRTLTDSNIVGMMIGDVGGRIHEANDAFLHLLGYGRADLAAGALDWKRLTPPQYLPQVEAVVEEIRRTGRNTPYEKEFVRRDGAHVPVLVGKAMLGGEDGRFVGFVLDLTERKRAERSLKASEDQLRLVTDTLPALISYVDADERYRFANRQYEQWFGTTRQAIYGKTIREVVGDAAYAQRRPFVERALGRGEVVRFDGPTPHRDGSVRDSEMSYVPDVGPDGRVRGMVVLAADVTEQRRTARALRRYADLFQHAELGLAVTAAADGVTLEMVNPAFARMYGYAPADLAGQSLLSVFAAEYRTEVPSHMRIARDRGHHTFESLHERKDGTQFPVEVDVTAARGEDGAVVDHVLSVTDITERERAGAEMERLLEAEQDARERAEGLARQAEASAREAAAANRSKDEFLATLSHELRTPLNAILGWAQLLRAGGMSEEEVAQGVETIERNARAQGQLVEDLLDLSRIISGKLRLEVVAVDLPAVIAAALDAARPAADAKGIRVESQVDGDVGAIRGDPNRLQQVAWNLLSNAIKFTPAGGEVRVRLGAAPDGQAELAVSDTGQGIRPELLPYVFDRLRQGDATLTRKHGGLGLGLSIVRHLVELHGGTVAAASEGEGRGATFTVRLPSATAAVTTAAVASPDGSGDVMPDHPAVSVAGGGGGADAGDAARAGAPAAMPSLHGVRVLVVDDEPDARELVQRVLRRCGADVSVAGSAAAAAEALPHVRPDVLLSDIGMPDEDGYSLIRRVRALPPDLGGATPAVALTAFARAEDRDRALDAGFQLHVTKPVEPAALARAVAELAGRSGGDGRDPTPVPDAANDRSVSDDEVSRPDESRALGERL
jgi:PAS domain S-box-containing protein